MRLCLLTVCEGAAVDSRTNRLTAYNIIDTISAATFPAVMLRMWIVCVVNKEDNEPDEAKRQLVVKLDDDILIDSVIEFGFGEGNVGRSLGELQGMIIPKPGTLTVSILDGDERMGHWCTIVESIGQPQPEFTPAT